MLARIRKAREEEGFTLIELLVVMIIIGILAAIAIPVFLNQRKSGYDAGAKSDVRNAATAEETNYTDTQAYIYGAALDSSSGLPGWNHSLHTTDVTITDNSVAPAVGQTYLITATSESGKKFCWDSSASDKGVYSC